MSVLFEQYLRSEGIHHEPTLCYAPQQNRVTKKYNQKVREAARRIIIESADLSESFWAKAVSTAVYVRNRVPTTAHKVMTTL